MITSHRNNGISLPDQPPFARLMQVVRQWRQSADLLLLRPEQTVDANPAAPAAPQVENRHHFRVPVQSTQVRVTDGCLCATAEIDNISPVGICLRHLPEQLYHDAERLTVFSSDNPGLPVLHIKPRWERIERDGKTIGATIDNASESWQLFFTRTAGQTAA